MYQLNMDVFERARLKTGKSLKELGIDPNIVYRARNGGRTQARTVAKLAEALGVDVFDLVRGGEANDA